MKPNITTPHPRPKGIKSGRKVERKPDQDHPTHKGDDWDRDRRVRLQHDHLVASIAITFDEFMAADAA